jgi:hypothetical protein
VGWKRARGIGMGIAYVPLASHAEILDLFRLAAEKGTAVYVQMRNGGPVEPGVLDALQEVIARPRAHVARLRVLRDYSAVTGTFAARRLLPDVRPSSGGSEDSGLRYHQGLTALPEQALRQITTAAGHSSGTRQRIAEATQQSTKSRRLQEGP